MKKVIATLLVCSALLTSACVADSGTQPDTTGEVNAEPVADLKQNMTGFSLDDMSALDAIDFDAYSVFLIGEYSNVAANTAILLSFIKYLGANHGVRHILHSGRYAEGLALNSVLRTGDETQLADFMKAQRFPTREMHDFYMDLYEYNQTIPEENRIGFVGIGVTTEHLYSIGVMRGIMNRGGEMPAAVSEVYEAIGSGFLDLAQENRAKAVEDAFNTVREYEAVFREYFGADYNDFYFGFQSLWQSYVGVNTGATGSTYNQDERLGFMCDNLSDMFSALELGKCIGMLPAGHVELDSAGLKDGNLNQLSLAEHMNTQYKLTAGKVLSFKTVYHKSLYLLSSAGTTMAVSGDLNDGELEAAMVAASTKDYAVFGTDGISNEGKPLSDSAQYLLLVKYSVASEYYV